MNDQQNRHIDTLIERIPRLLGCRQDINDAYVLLKKAYSNNRKLLVCGNGGSASDSEHIVGELMKEFRLKRKVYVNQAEAMKAIDPEMGQILAENLQGAMPMLILSLRSRSMDMANPMMCFLEYLHLVIAKTCYMQPLRQSQRDCLSLDLLVRRKAVCRKLPMSA